MESQTVVTFEGNRTFNLLNGEISHLHFAPDGFFFFIPDWILDDFIFFNAQFNWFISITLTFFFTLKTKAEIFSVTNLSCNPAKTGQKIFMIQLEKFPVGFIMFPIVNNQHISNRMK